LVLLLLVWHHHHPWIHYSFYSWRVLVLLHHLGVLLVVLGRLLQLHELVHLLGLVGSELSWLVGLDELRHVLIRVVDPSDFDGRLLFLFFFVVDLHLFLEQHLLLLLFLRDHLELGEILLFFVLKPLVLVLRVLIVALVR